MDTKLRSPRLRPRREPSGQSARLDALLDAAAVHYRNGDIEAAERLYLQAEAQDGEDFRARYSLAVIDLRRGRHAEARRRLKAVLRRRGEDFAALHNLGVAEQALGGWEAAAEAFTRALTLRPDAAETAFSLAVAQAVLGRIDAAIEIYRRLAAAPAHQARALRRMALLRPEAPDSAELAQLRALAAAGEGDEDGRIESLFALGGVLEARGEDERAFEAFASGNALQRARLQLGAPECRPDAVALANAASLQRMRRLFTAPFLAQHGGQGEAAARPIFIVGLPRSGSSLIEQILASHPQVQGLGESDAMDEAVRGRFPYPPTAPPQPDHFRQLARRYLEIQTRRGWSGRLRLVDKTLDNYLNVGLIHLMFPRAVILHARRDPADVGLACFRQLFARGNETLYDLADIGAEIRRHEAAMAHWREVLPGRVAEVAYEPLIADPPGRIRRLVTEACGLPWSEACMNFHTTRRSVVTASADQVRRPIFRSSVERWRRYERQLGPLLSALEG